MKSKSHFKPPTEDQEQAWLVAWMRKSHPEHRIFAIPNGGFRHKQTAVLMKATGASAGVPDLFIPSLRLFIEMKRKKGGRVSPEQKAWLEYLNNAGYKAAVCKGFLEAKEVIECYLSAHTSTI